MESPHDIITSKREAIRFPCVLVLDYLLHVNLEIIKKKKKKKDHINSGLL
ncbi:uncharacterized protein LACBIDRAFT_297277 [Laccaria bicolor S238N-H82]|uniref:Predicted protein n=1 Tax=Laccaria bicolor (strain S238N-H82 / ATCC MYA-4686) TaxID=486041 RepID=B0DAF0_LACBS|nr:uncharacterized protein LACBIDRAFT_297277 [Laccaria bicolor S238N-H82]EDR08519.1 predicted protein [Laccaria bicolor S238N-H82]|eukprot:XP_001880744.1 predicted protein [Laccaria bicolor S238N-H82]